MDVERVAFRALLYRELHEQRYTAPGDVGEHYAEEMGCELAAGAAAVFAEQLAPRDWSVIRAMDRIDSDPEHLASAIELLALYDPVRLEVMLHALDARPSMAPGVRARVLGRWSDVREAMRSFALWTIHPDDVPHEVLSWREQPGGEELAGELRTLLREWPPPGLDPASAARQFEQALARAMAEVNHG